MIHTVLDHDNILHMAPRLWFMFSPEGFLGWSVWCHASRCMRILTQRLRGCQGKKAQKGSAAGFTAPSNRISSREIEACMRGQKGAACCLVAASFEHLGARNPESNIPPKRALSPKPYAWGYSFGVVLANLFFPSIQERVQDY